MKTASTLLQILALSACFAIQVAAPGEFRMPGVRRAMQTMAGTTSQPVFPAQACVFEGIG
jgi:hypothetical protein